MGDRRWAKYEIRNPKYDGGRVAWVVPGFSASEADWCIPALLDLARVLSHRVDLHIFTLRYPHRSGTYRVFNATVSAFGGALGRGAATARLWNAALRAIQTEHKKRPFDLVHAFWAGETGLVAAVAARLIRRPCIIHLAGGEMVALHDIGYGGQVAWRDRLKTDLALRLVTRITAGSAYLLDLTRRRLPPPHAAKLSLSPLGVDLTRFHPASPLTPHPSPLTNHLRLLQVASLSPVKDQALLLEALARVRAASIPATLDLVGGEPDARYAAHLRRLADKLQVGEAVRWGGAVDHAGLTALYQRADLYVQSSRHEAQGMAVLEAGACGIPTVGTAVGVVADLAPAAALATPIGDADALADAIIALATPDQRLALGSAVYNRIQANYSLERTVNLIETNYMACRRL